jgi:hypothetical protein
VYSWVVEEWMEKLEVLLLKYALIFNMDETMLNTSGYKVKVFSHTNSGRFYTKEKTKLKHITLGLCISVSGEYIHSITILSVKTLSQLDTQVQGFFSIYSQPNGFIDNAIWYA